MCQQRELCKCNSDDEAYVSPSVRSIDSSQTKEQGTIDDAGRAQGPDEKQVYDNTAFPCAGDKRKHHSNTEDTATSAAQHQDRKPELDA